MLRNSETIRSSDTWEKFICHFLAHRPELLRRIKKFCSRLEWKTRKWKHTSVINNPAYQAAGDSCGFLELTLNFMDLEHLLVGPIVSQVLENSFESNHCGYIEVCDTLLTASIACIAVPVLTKLMSSPSMQGLPIKTEIDSDCRDSSLITECARRTLFLLSGECRYCIGAPLLCRDIKAESEGGRPCALVGHNQEHAKKGEGT